MTSLPESDGDAPSALREEGLNVLYDEGLNALYDTEATPSGTENHKHAYPDDSNTTSLTNLRDPLSKPLNLFSVPLLLFNDADTLVFIDRLQGTQTGSKKFTGATQTVPHRVHSKSLLDTNSSFFTKFFSPRYQARIQKRRGLEKNLPAGIKYVIDLTPATVDDEALLIMTEVSCPMAIRTWALRQMDWNLPASCVGGEDDMEPTDSVVPTERRAPERRAQPILPNFMPDDMPEGEKDGYVRTVQKWLDEGALGPPTGHPQVPLPLEYSQARHIEGIELVLHALEGLPVTLDTPCKMWTFFAVAKMMGLATNPTISGYITAWFYQGTNVSFIEVHPEIAYRVACGIESVDLCQFSFANLVGDATLLHFMRSANIHSTTPWRASFEYSRIHDVLQDTEIQRVEYASKSFADHLIKKFVYLTGVEMSWLSDIPEFSKITQHASQFPEDTELVNELTRSLKILVRTTIYQLLSKTENPLRSFDIPPPIWTPSRMDVFTPQKMIIKLMNREFWANLEGFQLHQPPVLDSSWEHRVYIDRELEAHDTIAALAPDLLLFQQQEDAVIRNQPGCLLKDQIYQFNERGFEQKVSPAEKRQHMELILEMRNKHASSPTPGSTSTPPTTDASSNATNVNSFSSMQAVLPYRPASQASDSQPQGTTGPPEITCIDLTTPAQRVLTTTTDKLFEFRVFKREVEAYLWAYAEAVMFPPAHTYIPAYATDVMTSLTDEEWKYLPLWAGGSDDGLGGVFAGNHVPMMGGVGFSAPGPAVHTGSIASSESSFGNINPSDSQSTVNAASHHATRSHVSYAISMDSNEFERQLVGDPTTTDHDVLPMYADDIRSIGASTVVDSTEFSELSDAENDLTASDDEMTASDDEYDFVDDMSV